MDEYQDKIKNIMENHYPKMAHYLTLIALALNVTPLIIFLLLIIDPFLIVIPLGFACGAVGYGWFTMVMSSKKQEGKKALGLGILCIILCALWYMLIMNWFIVNWW